MYKAARESNEWYDVVCNGVVFRKAVVTGADGIKTLVTIPKRDDLKVEYTMGSKTEPPRLLENRKERRRIAKECKGKEPIDTVDSFDPKMPPRRRKF